MRHHGPDALGLGLEAGKTQQRIEPDQPSAGAVQPVDLEGKAVVGIALQPVGDQQHNRTLGEHAARPQLVEGLQRGRDARAARPVDHVRRAEAERLVRIARLERARHVREPRSEEKRMHALSRIGDRVEEVQEEPRVVAHRAGDVEQRDDRRHLCLRSEIFKIDDGAARLEARAQGAPHVDQMAVPVAREPARAHLVEREHETGDRLPGGGDLGRRHLGEILFLQDLAIRHGEGRVDLGVALAFLELVVEAGKQRLLHARRGRRRRLRRVARRLWQHHAEELVEIAALAEEDLEGLAEDQRMLVPLHEHGVQRPVKILFGADAGRFHRLEPIQHSARADREAGDAQRAREMHDVVGETAVLPSPACGGE